MTATPRPRPTRRLLTALATALALVTLVGLAACGSGSAGGPGVIVLGPQSFNGTYWVVAYSADGGGSLSSNAWGTAVSDGVSLVSFDILANDGAGSVSAGTEMLEYTVAPDGSMVFGVGSSQLAQGGLNADGSCAVLGTAGLLPWAQIFVLIRRGGFFSQATNLLGDYHLSGFGIDAGDAKSPLLSQVTLDGAGGWSGTVGLNTNGSVDGGAWAEGYSIDSTAGAATLSFLGTTNQGGILQGDDIAIFGGDTAAGAPWLMLALRGGSGLSDATLSGAYWAVGIELDLGGAVIKSYTGTVTADGAGGMTLVGSVNDETASMPISQPVPYTVAPDGVLTANGDLTGSVTPDGAFATLGGGSLPGSNPVLFILSRK